MKIYGHRGHGGKYPESTMLASRKAAEVGCNGIELGAQLAKDGGLVVIYDETTERITDGAGFVWDYTYEELVRFGAGVIKDGAFGLQRISLFEEYRAWAAGEALVTNIEIKSNVFYYEGVEEKTIDMVREFGLAKRVVISSSNHMSLVHVKQLDAEIKIGVPVSQTVIGNIGYYYQQLGILYYHPNVKILTKEIAEECRMRGTGISAWTVNDVETLGRMREWGCNGVITNEVEMCRGETESQTGTKEEGPSNRLRLWGDLAGFLGSMSRGRR